MDDEKKIQSLRFWFFLVTSLFLVVTFVLYLPLRFRHQGEEDVHEEEVVMHNGEEEHDAAIYHEESDIREGIVVNFSFSPAPVIVASTTRLDFFVNRKPIGFEKSKARPVPVENLELEHERLMHVIGIRNDMEEFFHLHPEPSATTTGLLSVDYAFQNPGRYKVWSEIKKDGLIHAFSHQEFSVEGEGERYRKQVSFANNVIVGEYQVHLDNPQPLRAGVESDLEFSIRDLFGRPVALEPYLAADIHLSIIKDDLKRFIHTHPEDDHQNVFAPQVIPIAQAHEETGEAGEAKIISFHVAFPEAGLYRVFAQFRPVGIDSSPDDALTAAFWLRAEPPPKFAPTQRLLVAVSIILILVLSFVVKKYLAVHL